MSRAIKALTLYQPWASLVALGVKTIETRSWSTSYRGPLAIHAAKKTVYGPIGDYYAETWYSDVVHDNFRCYCEADGVGPPCTRGATRGPCLTLRERLVTMLPLGAVVATCTLVDVVPMTESEHYRPGDDNYMEPHLLLNGLNGKLWLWDGEAYDVEDQRPYGDFSPGRYAWLISDVRALDELTECRGRQGLWTLPEEVSRCLTATS